MLREVTAVRYLEPLRAGGSVPGVVEADDLGTCTHTVGALGKLAVDVQSLSRTEVGEVGEPHVPGRGSSSA
ncbi:hypothetical protein AB0I84_48220, partial [Streptomyces spectabilis]